MTTYNEKVQHTIVVKLEGALDVETTSVEYCWLTIDALVDDKLDISSKSELVPIFSADVFIKIDDDDWDNNVDWSESVGIFVEYDSLELI